MKRSNSIIGMSILALREHIKTMNAYHFTVDVRLKGGVDSASSSLTTEYMATSAKARAKKKATATSGGKLKLRYVMYNFLKFARLFHGLIFLSVEQKRSSLMSQPKTMPLQLWHTVARRLWKMATATTVRIVLKVAAGDEECQKYSTCHSYPLP